MKKQTYIQALWQRKWAVIAVTTCLLLLTVGLPSYNGEWHIVRLSEIEDDRERWGFRIGLVAVAIVCLLQVYNEWKRGNGGDVRLK